MRYGSVCSGIEAATMAWHPLGWTPAFFSEIEKFPSAVLAHHYGSNMPGEAASTNGVPNLGDMTKFQEWPDAAIDVLVGGTPCQSFSVAGLRAGLADPRGNLMLTYLAIAARYQPRWLVWENVPGVLSSNGGRDFGTFLGGLGECGYGFAYRVLDAQFCRTHGHDRAVPQRRRRVFVIGYLGDWRRAAAVLFDGASLRGDPPPRRQAGQGVAVSPTLRAGGNRTGGDRPPGTDVDTCETLIPEVAGTMKAVANSGGWSNSVDHAAGGYMLPVAHALRGEGFDASEDGTGRGTPLIAFAQNQRDEVREVPVAGALAAEPGMKQQTYLAHAIQAGATRENPASGPDGVGVQADIAYTLEARPEVQAAWAVRRLTPRECERLQGFPDDFTAIPHRGKPAADGPRYKALGNSMAVNVMRAIGERIAMVDAL